MHYHSCIITQNSLSCCKNSWKDSNPTGSWPRQFHIPYGKILTHLLTLFPIKAYIIHSHTTFYTLLYFTSAKKHQMAQLNLILVSLLFLTLFLHSRPTHAQLSRHHYKNSCPNVENIVREAVKKKFHQTFTTVPATLRLFFHDCFVQVINFNYMHFIWFTINKCYLF